MCVCVCVCVCVCRRGKRKKEIANEINNEYCSSYIISLSRPMHYTVTVEPLYCGHLGDIVK